MSDLPEPAQVHETIASDTRQVVRSPEQVALDLPIAGPTSRMLAYGIDYVVILLAIAAVLIFFVAATPLFEWFRRSMARWFGEMAKGQAPQAANPEVFLIAIGLFVVVQFLLEWGYFVLCEMSTGGRSLGKAVVGLRVVRDGGLPISIRESLIRNLLRMVDVLPYNYAIGLVSMLVSADGKRLGDLAAGTIVIRLDQPEAAPSLLDTEAEETANFRFDRAQIGRLGTAERSLLRQTLRRLESLPAEKAQAVLGQTVEVLRTRIGYEPVVEGDRVIFLRALLRAARGR